MRSWQRQIGCLNPANRCYPNIFIGKQNQALTLVSSSSKPPLHPMPGSSMSAEKSHKGKKIGTSGGELQGCSQNYAKPQKEPSRPSESIAEQRFCIPAHAVDAEPTPDVPLAFTSPYLLFFSQVKIVQCFATQLFVKQLSLFPQGKKKSH